MKKVRLLIDARREFFKEVEYYEGQRQGLGRKFRKAAEATFLRAGTHPKHGRPGRSETRRMPVKGFPFFVVYLESEHEVMVYAVVHTSREPDYWLSRLPDE